MRRYVDAYGRELLDTEDRAKADAMMFPCRCACGGLFDLAKVEVRHRYQDCSVFLLPCCNRTTDDRPAGWKSGPNYERLDKT